MSAYHHLSEMFLQDQCNDHKIDWEKVEMVKKIMDQSSPIIRITGGTTTA